MEAVNEFVQVLFLNDTLLKTQAVPAALGSPEAYEFAIDFGLALCFGILLGLQREIDGNPAGTTTHSLVCIGATGLTLMAKYGIGGDPSRIVSNIVTGIGFIGAG